MQLMEIGIALEQEKLRMGNWNLKELTAWSKSNKVQFPISYIFNIAQRLDIVLILLNPSMALAIQVGDKFVFRKIEAH
jgi:hypothetical protein